MHLVVVSKNVIIQVKYREKKVGKQKQVDYFTKLEMTPVRFKKKRTFD